MMALDPSLMVLLQVPLLLLVLQVQRLAELSQRLQGVRVSLQYDQTVGKSVQAPGCWAVSLQGWYESLLPSQGEKEVF